MSKFENGVNSWEQVDDALRRMGEIEIAVTKIGADATLKINEIKDEAKTKAAGLESERKHLEKIVTLFAESRKAEFAKKRSKELNFGTVGYRLVQKVSMPRDKEKVAALLKSLIAYGHGDCIVYEEKPDKDKIAALADDTIAKLGLKRSTEDSFRIQPKIEKVQEAEGE